MMPQIDMSREAVTARLKLVSELQRLCLSLGTARIRTKASSRNKEVENHKQTPSGSDNRQK